MGISLKTISSPLFFPSSIAVETGADNKHKKAATMFSGLLETQLPARTCQVVKSLSSQVFLRRVKGHSLVSFSCRTYVYEFF